MKKIVVIQSYKEQVWIFGVFPSFKNAYENLMQYHSSDIFGNNVREFIQSVRNEGSFEKQNKEYIYEGDGSGMIPDDADYHISNETFIVQEVDLSKTYPRTTFGIGRAWDRKVA